MAIVDIHGHLNSPPELMAFKSGLLSSRIHRSRGSLKLSDDRLKPIVDNHVKKLDEVGTDIQFLSPRPFQLMQSDPLFSIVEDFCKANNDAIKQSVDYYPDRYRGVCGLPQVWGQPVNVVFEEMERSRAKKADAQRARRQSQREKEAAGFEELAGVSPGGSPRRRTSAPPRSRPRPLRELPRGNHRMRDS